jgi:steroid delta-isomerase-like uncharacterized protein
MHLDRNKSLVRRYYDEVLSQGDLDVLTELLHSDFVSHGAGGLTFGADKYRAAVIASRLAFPDLRVTVEDQVAEGDKVVTRWTARGTHSAPYFGLPASHRPIVVSAIHIHRVANGKLLEHWEHIDALGVLQQMGAIPPRRTT